MTGSTNNTSNSHGCGSETPTDIQVLGNCDLLYNSETGPQTIPYWSQSLFPKIEALLPTSLEVLPSCDLVFTNFEGAVQIPYWTQFLLPKIESLLTPSTFSYDAATHTVIHNGQPWQLNCGSLSFNPNTCELGYTDEKSVYQSFILPQDQFIYNPGSCELTILPAKGGQPLSIPVGVPAGDVSFQLLEGKVLELGYKDKKCQVQLPNSVIGCSYVRASNTLSLVYCDGTVDAKDLAKASLNCTVLDDGTQVLAFNDGCSPQSKMFNIPAVVADIDNATLVADVLTLNYGGDGNPGSLTVPLCQIIATHCNATIVTQYPDGGFDFIDNAGQTFEVRPVNCCTFHGTNPAPINPSAPPSAPAGNYPTKNDRDTLIECHPNGLAFYTCVNGNWVFDFVKLAEQEVHIGSAQPVKSDGFKVWFDPATCVVRYCDDNGAWFEPRNVLCQVAEPDTEKGEADLWYNPSNCCFSILCEGTWIGVNGVVMDAVIQALCVQVGNGPAQAIQVVNGKAIIPIPEMDMDKVFCIQIGDAAPIFAEQVQTLDGKYVFQLPALPEYCIRLGGDAPDNPVFTANVDPSSPNSNKLIFDLPAYPTVPQAVTKESLVSGFTTVTSDTDVFFLGVNSQGECVKASRPTPTPPTTKEDIVSGFESSNDGTNVAFLGVDADGNCVKVPRTQIAIPNVLVCSAAAPATDGSQGILWLNETTGCLHALCSGVWIGTNGADAVTA